MFFHQNLKTIRKAWGLSQETVSEKFEVSQATISAWEQATVPDLGTIIRLADYYKVTVDDLLKKEFTRQNAPDRRGVKEYPQQPDESVTEVQEPVDLKLKDEMDALRREMVELKEDFKRVAGGDGERVKIFEALMLITEHLEGGLDESEYKEEKKALRDKLTGLLRGS